MYNFVDVTEASESNVLPSEAMMFNGEYLENLIAGYRTLNVTGREALSPLLDTFETGTRDGERLKGKRYPPRILVITYQLITESNEAFREAYNQLGGILDVEDAQIIFNDEQDKFYTGTPSLIGEVEPGLNSVIGKIEITCYDPFKYSLLEHEADAALGDTSILVDYNGTYKAYPILQADFYKESDVADDGETAQEITGAGDCGYVAFFTEDEKIIQLGDPNEADGISGLAKSQTLFNQTFQSPTAWGTTAQSLWAVNSSPPFPVTVANTGSVVMAPSIKTSAYYTTAAEKYILTAAQNSVQYRVKAQSYNRTANAANIKVTVTANCATMIDKNAIIQLCLTVNGVNHRQYLKTNFDGYWGTHRAITRSFVITVSGLTSSQSSFSGIYFKAERLDGNGTNGSFSQRLCTAVPLGTYVSGTESDYYLTPSSYGTASGYTWHGPSITQAIKADAAGVVGAKSFTLTYQQKMCIGNYTNASNEYGGFHCYMYDSNNVAVAGVRVVKTAAGRNASLMLFVNGIKVHQVGIDLSYNNPYFGAGSNAVRTTTIRKDGSTIVFNVGGYRVVFTESAVKDKAVTKVTFMFEQRTGATALSYNGLYYAKFVKDNCDTYKDTPNKFSANDVLEADCRDGSIYLNGIASPELGALGNNWEDFVLTPGLNQIGYSFSEWVKDEYAPTVKLRYREVFL